MTQLLRRSPAPAIPPTDGPQSSPRHPCRTESSRGGQGAALPPIPCPLYPELEMPHLYLGLSVATGQLEVLTEEACVIEECRDGVLHYRKTA